jgi:hypothetical protein
VRANRNYAGEYVRDTVDQLYQLLGEAGAHDVVAHTMRVLAAQYVHELAGDVKIDASSAEGLAGLHGELHRACGGGYQLERISVAAWRLTLLAHATFSGAWEELPASLRVSDQQRSRPEWASAPDSRAH